MARPPRITAAMCAHGRALAEPRLAPDGSRLAFLATTGGRAHLVAVDPNGGPERVLTSDPPPRPTQSYGGGTYDWVPDGGAVVYAAVDGGLWWQPAEGGPPRCVAPCGPLSAPAVSPDGAWVAYLLDARHVAVVGLGPGARWPVQLSGAADFCFDPTWSADGRWVAWHEWDIPAMPWNASRVAARRSDGSGEVLVVAGGERTAVAQPRFSSDGSGLGFLSDAHGWLNLWVASESLDDPRPLLEEAHEHGSPAWGPGQRSFAWSPDGRTVALARNEEGFGSLGLVDVATGISRPLGSAVHGGLSWAGGRLAAVRSGARTPTEVVVYEAAGLARRRTVATGPVAGFEAAGLSEPETVHWPGDDGREVPGRLYRATSTALGDPPPLIAWVHGGPTGQLDAGFHPRLAFWADRGWAVLAPDHRGSSGHSRAFTEALAGRWGELDVADVAAGLRAAADRGWGDRHRLVALGGSAGGFTVLNLLAFHPDLCAAGVDLFGVADLFELEETTHRFEAHYLQSLVGTLPESAARYRERSPVNLAERITAPLLILQGADDEIVPPAQSRCIADRLRALGRTVELHLYEGEGHGWSRAETVVDELERTESFLRRHVLRRREGAGS